jgi:hypothetical protein
MPPDSYTTPGHQLGDPNRIEPRARVNHLFTPLGDFVEHAVGYGGNPAAR